MDRQTPSTSPFMSETRSPSAVVAADIAADGREPVPGTDARTAPIVAVPSHAIEPPSVPDGTFVKVSPGDHPLPRACEVTVNFQDYHRSSSKLGRFGKIVGIDIEAREYLVMLDNFECLAAPMRRVEWRKVAT
jgi:hypothetical protein